jgi:AraC family transcriptional regulator, regulatory protein of adaptative response / DNA-3-methyladenine glycosylase II
VLDTGTEATLGARLGISVRHLRRLFRDYLGVTPDQLARLRRAHFARRLLDDSDLTIADVAFASGFGSIRQFNRAMVEVFRARPRELRERRRKSDRLVADGGLLLRLPLLEPYDWRSVLEFLEPRAVPGVEEIDADVYRRTVMIDGAPGLLELGTLDHGHLWLRVHLPFWEGLIHVAARAARIAGIDVDVTDAHKLLRADPLLGPLVAARSGLRVPGAWGPFEVAVHTVISDCTGLDHTRELLAELVRRHGTPIPGLGGELTHAFPSPAHLATLDTRSLGLPGDLSQRIVALADAVVSDRLPLDGSVDLGQLAQQANDQISASLIAAHHLALRLGERDAFPACDPRVMRTLHTLDTSAKPDVSDAWRPFRSLAAVHLLLGMPDR